MIFLKSHLAFWLIIGFSFFMALLLINEKKFFNWVKIHWQFERSTAQIISTTSFVLGIALLAVVLLDPRKGETKIKGKIRQDKTIILIDTSTSMLAEDVRPSRLEKAVLVAKHFTRKAVGHQIGVMVFADITKKLVPFTTDLDLLDSRIDSIRGLRNMNAGSSIGLAIEEAVQFFDAKETNITGNIIVITDGEDNAETDGFKIPDGISLALIGVGSAAGSTIPMKDNLGMFYGQKKNKGITVVTRLNEEFFKNAVSNSKNAKYFLTKSYDLPTEDVLAFLNIRKGQEKESDNVIRPVALEVWALPGLILILISLVLKSFRPYTLVLIFCLNSSFANEEKVEIPPAVLHKIEQLKKGDLDKDERINLADQLVKLRMHDMAQALYEENLDDRDAIQKSKSFFNWATSELETGKIEQALDKYSYLEDKLKDHNPSDQLLNKIRENIKRAIVPPPQKDNKESKDEDKSQDQEQKNSGESGDGKGGESKDKNGSQKDSSDSSKNPFDPKNKDEKKEDKGQSKENQEKEKNESNRDENKMNPKKDEQDGDDQPEGEKKKEKLSPLIQQLKQDDRKLQLKLLDTSTQKRKEGRKKDW